VSADPYYSSNPDPSGDEEAFEITMDALVVARLRRGEVEEESAVELNDWVLTSEGGLAFEDVSISGNHEADEAVRNAIGWLANYVERERPDLLEDE
jgi:hypothetical protein